MKRHLESKNEIRQSSFGMLGCIIVGSAQPRYADPMKGRR